MKKKTKTKASTLFEEPPQTDNACCSSEMPPPIREPNALEKVEALKQEQQWAERRVHNTEDGLHHSKLRLSELNKRLQAAVNSLAREVEILTNA